jgi:hypothetical protein
MPPKLSKVENLENFTKKLLLSLSRYIKLLVVFVAQFVNLAPFW